tara:strand:+ start:3769 stop:5466 length:1698 start_codon:yes stop_codon:yes gene_type:complete
MAYKYQSLAATMSGSLTQEGDFTVKNDAGTTGFSATAAGAVSGSGALSAGGNLQTAGTVKLTGVADAALAPADDSLYFLDSDGLMKSERVTDFATSLAGPGIAAVGGAFEVDLDEFDELAATPHATQDEYLISDNGTEKRINVTNAANGAFALVSGDITIAAGGAATIGNDAVETAMLNDNVISGQSELAQGGLAAADEFLISDGGTLKRYGVDSFAKDALALTTEAAIADGDYITFLDGGATGETKKEAVADLATLFAGGGLSAASSVMAVSVSGAVHVASDKVSISGSIAGSGLTYTGGVDSIATLAIDIDELGALGSATVAQADNFLLSDAGTEKKVTFSNLEDSIFANVGGDIAIAAGGSATIQNDAVESGMLNDNVISGQTELASDGLAAADEMMISDGGTLKKIGVDNLMKDAPGLLTAAAIDVTADHFMFLDGGATGDAKIESIVDLVAGMAGAGLTAGSGQLSVTGNNVALKADSGTLVEGYNYFADASSDATVSMPAAPSVGDVVTVKAGNLTSGAKIIINRQGSHEIDGLTSIEIESPYGAVTMVYVVANDWRIV